MAGDMYREPEIFGGRAEAYLEYHLEAASRVQEIEDGNGISCYIGANIGNPDKEIEFTTDRDGARVVMCRGYHYKRKKEKFLVAEREANAIEMTALAVAANSVLPELPLTQELSKFVREKLEERKRTAEMYLGKLAASRERPSR